MQEPGPGTSCAGPFSRRRQPPHTLDDRHHLRPARSGCYEQLARDPSAALRAAAADNSALPAAALTKLATGDPDRRVRLAAHTRHPPSAEIIHSAVIGLVPQNTRASRWLTPTDLPADARPFCRQCRPPTRLCSAGSSRLPAVSPRSRGWPAATVTRAPPPGGPSRLPLPPCR